MIFVTVGTHEQPFNRLLKSIDKLVEDGTVYEEVIVQSGYSTYEPKYCKWQKIFSYPEMKKKVADARIVITHGGPSSFIMPLNIGKIPIVVARTFEYKEHVNNHQVDFCNAVADRLGTIILVKDTEKLGEIVRNYDKLVNDINIKSFSNNAKFNSELEIIVSKLFSR